MRLRVDNFVLVLTFFDVVVPTCSLADWILKCRAPIVAVDAAVRVPAVAEPMAAERGLDLRLPSYYELAAHAVGRY